MRVPTECLECHQPFKARGYGTDFCGSACRQKYNNRRMVRGAILYDLVMAESEDPRLFERYGLTGRKDRLLAAWRSEDAAKERQRTTKRLYDVQIDTLPYGVKVSRS